MPIDSLETGDYPPEIKTTRMAAEAVRVVFLEGGLSGRGMIT